MAQFEYAKKEREEKAAQMSLGGLNDPDGWWQAHWKHERPGLTKSLSENSINPIPWSATPSRTTAQMLLVSLQGEMRSIFPRIPPFHVHIITDWVRNMHLTQTEYAALRDISQPTACYQRQRATEAILAAQTVMPRYTPLEVLEALLETACEPTRAWVLAWSWRTWAKSGSPLGHSPGWHSYSILRAAQGLIVGGGKVPEEMIPGFEALAFGQMPKPAQRKKNFIEVAEYPAWLPHPDTL